MHARYLETLLFGQSDWGPVTPGYPRESTLDRLARTCAAKLGIYLLTLGIWESAALLLETRP